MKRTMILLTVAVLLLLTGAVLAQGTPSVDWWVIGGGGGHVENGNQALDGTIGQAVVGVVSNDPYELCSGFWCWAAVEYKMYLPVIFRNYP